MTLDKPKLAELTELSELQFTPAECATVMELDPEDLEEEIAKGLGPVFAAYERGRLLAVAEVRKAILTQAKQGSSPAQKQMIEIMDRTAREQRRVMQR